MHRCSGLTSLASKALIAAKPAVYFITDHYRGYAAVLARLSKLSASEARDRLSDAWSAKAPTSLRSKLG